MIIFDKSDLFKNNKGLFSSLRERNIFVIDVSQTALSSLSSAPDSFSITLHIGTRWIKRIEAKLIWSIIKYAIILYLK